MPLGKKPLSGRRYRWFQPLVKDGILHEMARQTEQAIAEADASFSWSTAVPA